VPETLPDGRQEGWEEELGRAWEKAGESVYGDKAGLAETMDLLGHCLGMAQHFIVRDDNEELRKTSDLGAFYGTTLMENWIRARRIHETFEEEAKKEWENRKEMTMKQQEREIKLKAARDASFALRQAQEEAYRIGGSVPSSDPRIPARTALAPEKERVTHEDLGEGARRRYFASDQEKLKTAREAYDAAMAKMDEEASPYSMKKIEAALKSGNRKEYLQLLNSRRAEETKALAQLSQATKDIPQADLARVNTQSVAQVSKDKKKLLGDLQHDMGEIAFELWLRLSEPNTGQKERDAFKPKLGLEWVKKWYWGRWSADQDLSQRIAMFRNHAANDTSWVLNKDINDPDNMLRFVENDLRSFIRVPIRAR